MLVRAFLCLAHDGHRAVNKTARITWAIMVHGGVYEAGYHAPIEPRLARQPNMMMRVQACTAIWRLREPTPVLQLRAR